MEVTSMMRKVVPAGQVDGFKLILSVAPAAMPSAMPRGEKRIHGVPAGICVVRVSFKAVPTCKTLLTLGTDTPLALSSNTSQPSAQLLLQVVPLMDGHKVTVAPRRTASDRAELTADNMTLAAVKLRFSRIDVMNEGAPIPSKMAINDIVIMSSIRVKPRWLRIVG